VNGILSKQNGKAQKRRNEASQKPSQIIAASKYLNHIIIKMRSTIKRIKNVLSVEQKIIANIENAHIVIG